MFKKKSHFNILHLYKQNKLCIRKLSRKVQKFYKLLEFLIAHKVRFTLSIFLYFLNNPKYRKYKPCFMNNQKFSNHC